MAPQPEQTAGDELTGLRAQTLRLAADLPGALRSLRVRSGEAVIEVEWQDADAARVTLAEPDETAPRNPLVAQDFVEVRSPMVGTVYRAPNPDEPPFVSVGDVVEPGQTVAVVEAMKLFNPITAEVGGVVLEVLVADGAPVEFGQPLLRLETSADERAVADVH